MERLVVVLASNTCIMDKEGLFLKTILCCSACDGEIAPEEIAELKSITSNMDIFKDVDVESDLNQMIESLNEKGVDFLMEYVDSITRFNLSDEDQLMIVKLAIDMIESDNKILYSEVKFFKRIRKNLTISDELILSRFPDKEDYLLPDIIEPMDKLNWNFNFEKINL